MSKLLGGIAMWKVLKYNFSYLGCKVTLVNQYEYVLDNPSCQRIELRVSRKIGSRKTFWKRRSPNKASAGSRYPQI